MNQLKRGFMIIFTKVEMKMLKVVNLMASSTSPSYTAETLTNVWSTKSFTAIAMAIMQLVSELVSFSPLKHKIKTTFVSA